MFIALFMIFGVLLLFLLAQIFVAMFRRKIRVKIADKFGLQLVGMILFMAAISIGIFSDFIINLNNDCGDYTCVPMFNGSVVGVVGGVILAVFLVAVQARAVKRVLRTRLWPWVSMFVGLMGISVAFVCLLIK